MLFICNEVQNYLLNNVDFILLLRIIWKDRRKYYYGRRFCTFIYKTVRTTSKILSMVLALPFYTVAIIISSYSSFSRAHNTRAHESSIYILLYYIN